MKICIISAFLLPLLSAADCGDGSCTSPDETNLMQVKLALSPGQDCVLRCSSDGRPYQMGEFEGPDRAELCRKKLSTTNAHDGCSCSTCGENRPAPVQRQGALQQPKAKSWQKCDLKCNEDGRPFTKGPFEGYDAERKCMHERGTTRARCECACEEATKPPVTVERPVQNQQQPKPEVQTAMETEQECKLECKSPDDRPYTSGDPMYGETAEAECAKEKKFRHSDMRCECGCVEVKKVARMTCKMECKIKYLNKDFGGGNAETSCKDALRFQGPRDECECTCE